MYRKNVFICNDNAIDKNYNKLIKCRRIRVICGSVQQIFCLASKDEANMFINSKKNYYLLVEVECCPEVVVIVCVDSTVTACLVGVRTLFSSKEQLL
jgi:hypothetical protein